MDLKALPENKKLNQSEFSLDYVIEDSKQNEATFNSNSDNEKKSIGIKEHDLIIDGDNQQIQQSPTLNLSDQASISVQKNQSPDKLTFLLKKNAKQNSISDSYKNLITVQQDQIKSVKKHSPKNLRSIYISENKKKVLQKSKQHQKGQFGPRPSHVPQRKIVSFLLLKQIHQKMTFFLKNFTSTGRSKYLNDEKQYQIRKAINDNGDYIQSKSKQKFYHFLQTLINYFSCFQILKKCCYLSQCITIVPNSLFNMLSLMFFCFFNYIFYFLISINIVYQGYITYEKIIIIFIVTIWVVEIFVQINTQIYQKTNLISNRKIIITQYIKYRAIYDLIPLISVFLSMYVAQRVQVQKSLQIISFLKFVNILKDTNNMQKLLCMSVKNYYIIQLFNLVFKISVLSHVVACVWFVIGKIELYILQEETTWYDDSIGADGTWWKLYLQSMYWSLTLIITGSNEAKTTAQILYTSFIMLFTAIIFGYMLNTTGTILQQLNQRDEEKRKDLNILNDYMRQQKISKGLQGRVNLDLEYQYINNLKQDQQQKEEVLSKISPHLQKLLKLEQCKQALEKFRFLSRNFSKEAIKELSLEFYEEFYSPNEVVFADKQVNNLSMILILQGSLQIYQQIDKQFQPVQLLNEGEIIGQVNFFTGLEFQYSVKSVDFTKVIKIDRDKFLEIVQKREKDYEKYCFIRDQQQFYMQYNALQTRCTFCHQYSHLSTQCNLVHLDKQSGVFLAKFQQNIQQSRFKHLRKQMKQNSYMISMTIQQSVNRFIFDEIKTGNINPITQTNNMIDMYQVDSDQYETDQSIKFFSTFQILFSQQSLEDEREEKELPELKAQKVNFSNNFNREKMFKLNQNYPQTKITEEIDSEKDIEEKQELTPQEKNQLEIKNHFQEKLKKRESFLKIQNNQITRNTTQTIDVKKKNQNHDIPRLLIRQRVTQDMNLTPSNLFKKHDFVTGNLSIQNELKPPSSRKKDKKYDQENPLNKNQRRKSSILQKPMSMLQILEEEKKLPMFIFDFDIQKNMLFYFPHGNLANIIYKYNKRLRRKFKCYLPFDKKKDKNEEKKQKID